MPKRSLPQLPPTLLDYASRVGEPRLMHEPMNGLWRQGFLEIAEQPLSKNTEMHPLVRWQYRGGIPEKILNILFTCSADYMAMNTMSLFS